MADEPSMEPGWQGAPQRLLQPEPSSQNAEAHSRLRTTLVLVVVVVLVGATVAAGVFGWHQRDVAHRTSLELQRTSQQLIVANRQKQTLTAELNGVHSLITTASGDSETFRIAMNQCLGDFKTVLQEMQSAGPYPSFTALAVLETQLAVVSTDCGSVNSKFQQLQQDLASALTAGP
jgi:hypothetical protein